MPARNSAHQKIPNWSRASCVILIGRPGRIEDDLHFDVAHAGKLPEHLLAVGDHLRAGGAHGAGHRHVDLAVRLAFGGRHEIDVVDQPQIDDVDEQLGVDDLLQLFADEVFADLAAGGSCAADFRGRSLLPASGSWPLRLAPSSCRRREVAALAAAGVETALGLRANSPGSHSRTKISSPSTFTSWAAVSTVAGIVSALPVRMSNFAPCRGQAIA